MKPLEILTDKQQQAMFLVAQEQKFSNIYLSDGTQPWLLSISSTDFQMIWIFFHLNRLILFFTCFHATDETNFAGGRYAL